MDKKDNRFLKLAKMGEKVFHTDDLANIWQISDRNTLNTALKRYTAKGWLYRIQKGLYAVEPAEKIDPWLLGTKVMHEYCYVSCETVLARAGVIQQAVKGITLVGGRSRRFTAGGHRYYCRQMKDEFLYQDIGVAEKSGARIASPERAAADLLYFNPRAHFDNPGGLNLKKLRQIKKIIGY